MCPFLHETDNRIRLENLWNSNPPSALFWPSAAWRKSFPAGSNSYRVLSAQALFFQ
jgi:hypothetical protein